MNFVVVASNYKNSNEFPDIGVRFSSIGSFLPELEQLQWVSYLTFVWYHNLMLVYINLLILHVHLQYIFKRHVTIFHYDDSILN